MTSKRNFRHSREKAPQLLLIAIVVIAVAIVLVDTLEDTLIEGGPFTGTSLDIVLNAIIQLTQNVTAAVSSWGYSGIFLLMVLESSSLPIPSEVILPFSGYLVSLGQLDLWITILVSTLAGIVGSLIDYYIGMNGANLLARRKTFDRLLSGKRVKLAEDWFHRYGFAAVFLSRMIPGFRTLVSFPAGAVKMSLWEFVVFTLAGCLVWNTVLIYIGVYVGANWRQVAGASRYLIIGVLVALLVVFVAYLIKRKRNRPAPLP